MKNKPLKTRINCSPFTIIVFILLTAIHSLQTLGSNTNEKLVSPDKQISIVIEILEATPVYSVWFNKHQIIKTSSLGFELESSFNVGFKLISKEKGKINRKWNPLYGENSELSDNYNLLTIHLKENGKPYRLLNIEFRAYNEGFAFRYPFPYQALSNNWIIKREHTEFRFINGAKAFPIYSGEATFSKIPDLVKEIKPGACYPLTINTGFGYASILEAYVVNYPL